MLDTSDSLADLGRLCSNRFRRNDNLQFTHPKGFVSSSSLLLVVVVVLCISQSRFSDSHHLHTPFLSCLAHAQVLFGRRWGIALTQDGKIFTWGQNTGGQLGLGDFEPRNSPTMIPPESFNLDPMQETIINIACRNRQVFAWTSESQSQERKKERKKHSKTHHF